MVLVRLPVVFGGVLTWVGCAVRHFWVLIGISVLLADLDFDVVVFRVGGGGLGGSWCLCFVFGLVWLTIWLGRLVGLPALGAVLCVLRLW